MKQITRLIDPLLCSQWIEIDFYSKHSIDRYLFSCSSFCCLLLLFHFEPIFLSYSYCCGCYSHIDDQTYSAPTAFYKHRSFRNYTHVSSVVRAIVCPIDSNQFEFVSGDQSEKRPIKAKPNNVSTLEISRFNRVSVFSFVFLYLLSFVSGNPFRCIPLIEYNGKRLLLRLLPLQFFFWKQ